MNGEPVRYVRQLSDGDRIVWHYTDDYKQEEIAEKINISRQAYAKWESGATVPYIVKCNLLASVYGVTLDSLMKTESAEGMGMIPPAPKGKNIWGSVTVSDRGQIVIPKEARDKFALTGGKRLIVLSDEDGIALVPAERFEEKMKQVLEFASMNNESDS